MRLLLDTHLVYWSFYETSRVPQEAKRLFASADAVFVSAASIWEIAIKAKLGKIHADPKKIVNLLPASGFRGLLVRLPHAAAVADLPLHHRDPFDRLLVAQAVCEPLRLITCDSQLAAYSDLVIVV
ncbi:MAG TPA: type II toxin-antitoxin system VapC family toxin [Terracidiphilus sp.]|nr:type II toxin-antitoxin system VapC family toxin [Terracidiphilus sp.]